MHPLSRALSVLSSLFVISFVIFATPVAEAAKITAVKGKDVRIDLEGQEAARGDTFFVVVGGKRTGIVVVRQAKGGKAAGRLARGKAAVGARLSPRKRTGATAQGGSKAAPSATDGATTYGVLVGYSMVSQSVKLSTGTTISMADNALSLKGFADIPIAGSLGILTRFGLENFSAKSTSVSPSGQAYATKITYFTGDLLMRYTFMSGTFEPYVAGGLGIFYPMSKETNVLAKDRISATSVFFGTLGANWKLSPTMYVPVQIEYAMFPPSDEVTTSMVNIRTGLGLTF